MLGLAGKLSKPAEEASLLWASGGLTGSPTAPMAPFWGSCCASSLECASFEAYVQVVWFTSCRYRSAFKWQKRLEKRQPQCQGVPPPNQGGVRADAVAGLLSTSVQFDVSNMNHEYIC